MQFIALQYKSKIMRPILLLLTAFLLLQTAHTTNLQITHVERIEGADNTRSRGFVVTLEWENSWHNARNHDAAWIFLKYLTEDGASAHIFLEPGSAEQLYKGDATMPEAALDVAEDRTGVFVYAREEYRGPLSYRFYVALDTSAGPVLNYPGNAQLRCYGVEMVYIPEGPFSLGDPDTLALNFGAYYRSGTGGTFDGLYQINSADQEIPVGPEVGSLNYRVEDIIYQGDQRGPIPPSFPNGYGAFYLMKYELSQGLYADFLNTLGDFPAAHRANFGSRGYSDAGGTIHLEGDCYVADAPTRRNVFMHWDDMMAWTDWAALRPYTEFEYTKAACGPQSPLPLEYPWNNSSLDGLMRTVDPDTKAMQMLNGLTEADLTEVNRTAFGASYYWVLDLAGGMWEKVITPADLVGRQFTGPHGNGTVDYYGFADVNEWPTGFHGESAGYGYRGGGYYGRPGWGDFNPYSPIAYRLYGAWSGGPRNVAYGFRAARTAP